MKAWIFSLVAGLALLAGNGAQGALPAGKEVKVDGVTYELLGNGEAAVCASDLEVKQFVIPSEITVGKQSYRVTVVKNKKGKQGQWGDIVEEITVPGSVRYIGETAFWGQRALRRVVIEEGVQDIYGKAFSCCGALEKVVFPSTLKTIGYSAFEFCISLKEVVVFGDLEAIGSHVFWWCENLESVNLYVTKLSQLDLSIFSGCNKLGALFLPEHLKSVKNERNFDHGYGTGIAMSYETLLALNQSRNTYFLNGIQVLGLSDAESIDVHVPSICPSMSIILFLNNVKAIGDYAFSDDDMQGKLTDVDMCNTITKIGKGAFSGNPKLSVVDWSQNLEVIGALAFMGCKSLERVDLPVSIREIWSKAFLGCDALKEVKGLNSSVAYLYPEGEGPFDGTPVDLEALKQTYSYYALGIIARDLREWQQKREFETTVQWQQRVTSQARDARVKELTEKARQGYIEKMKPARLSYTLGRYDADYNIYTIDAGAWGEQYIQVPLGEAPAFKANFGKARIVPTYGIRDDRLALVAVDVTLDGKTYRNTMPVDVQQGSDLALNLPALKVNLGNDRETRKAVSEMPMVVDRAVDMNIPVAGTVAANTFAVVIGNERYQHETSVPYAGHDAEVFAEYCRKTLGIPEKNIRVLKDATLNNMKFQLDWLRQVLSAYNGEARAIVYYAGHGIPDEADRGAYLLPADGYGSNTGTGFALKDFYAMLSAAPAESVTVFLDACFSGTKRESGMLASARGVAIKVRDEAPQGNLVVFTAAQGDETAYQYAEKGHGMFTYFLLKKLQESKGDVTLGELGDYITGEVKKASVVNNNKIQTPTVIPAAGMADWRRWTLK